jgi:phosphopantetheinyl transferase (holo-ACP synthase)
VPSRSRVEDTLKTLRAAGLIQRTGLVPVPTFRFKHALTLDVTYESLLARQRKERHAQVAEAIENLYAEQLEERSEQLATHFAAAEDWGKAIHYGLAAAKRAESLWRLPRTVKTVSTVQKPTVFLHWALQRLSEVSREEGEKQKAGAFSVAALAIGRQVGDKELESLASEVQSADNTEKSDC